MITKQQKLVKFALKYADKWHHFAKDYETVSLICATSNLGIIKVDDDMFVLKSANAARMFLNR